MQSKHEPDSRFVENLEWQLRTELRRRDHAGKPAPSPARRLVRTAALVAASFAFGAVAYAASQRIEESWRRDLLVSSLEVRLDLARQRTVISAAEADRVDELVRIGAAEPGASAGAALQVARAEARAKMLELELEEVRLSGSEPLDEVSAPLVAGRDFAGERIGVQIEVARQSVELAALQLDVVQTRNDVGVGDPTALASARSVVSQAEQHVRSLRRHLEIRREFLAGDLEGIEAELLVMHADAEERANAMRQQLEVATLEAQRAATRVEVGATPPAMLRRLELQVAEIEAELQIALREQQVVQREIDARRERP